MFNNNSTNDSDINGGNKGNRGKFNDRLSKMRRDRVKKGKLLNDLDFEENENIILNTGRNILKVVLSFPAFIYSNIKTNKSHNLDQIHADNGLDNEFAGVNDYNDIWQKRQDKVNEIRQMNISLLKKQREYYLKKQNDQRDEFILSNDENELKIASLQKQIIDLIKKKLVENVNQLEVLYSELYLLKELNGEDIYLKDCQEDIKEVKKLLSKVKSLKEKYDYLKDNVDFEYMLEYGDDLLIDKILELKRLCSDSGIKYIVDNYKILDEYKFLYLKIDKLQEDTIRYEEYKNIKAEELKQRDIDFDKLKNEVYDIDKESDRYNEFVRQQELFMSDLDNKISKIDSYESVSYRLKGFNQLLGNSFKYLGLLLMHPLKAFLPGIAAHTLLTKNTIRNLYNNLEWEENKKMVYEAIDYSVEINRAINNLDITSSLIDSTLEDIARLKARYQKEFSKYEYSFSGYRDTIKKINKMENAVLGNKIKVIKMQERMKERERQNKNKLKMVKKLNNSSNNS